MASTCSATHQIWSRRTGLYYETYQEMREAHVRLNEQRLEELGLHVFSPRNGTGQGPKRKKSSIPPSSTTPVEPMRRSERKVIVRQPVNIPDHSAAAKKIRGSDRHQGDSDRPVKKHRTATVESRKDVLKSSLFGKLRQKLGESAKEDEFWLTQFKDYWRPKISDQNFRSISRQVDKLACGLGITYKQWPSGTWFHKDKRIDMWTDFDELYKLAVKFEQEFGRDRGNGWLMRIPIKKLSIFQRHYIEKLLRAKATEGEDLSESCGAIPFITNENNKTRTKVSQPRFAIGMKFEKEFPGFGKYVGQIVSFNGSHYQVYYPEDGDEEDLSEFELKQLKILPPHSSEKSTVEQKVPEIQENGTPSPEKPRFPVGTTFAKVFPGHGIFEGHVESFNGAFYQVFYPFDGDSEELSESQLEKLMILSHESP